MLDNITKKNIDDCRDVLVGKVPDPKSQIEQITLALIYKFMDDMDREAVEKFKGKAKFFTGGYSKYGWRKLFDPSLSGKDMLDLYSEALDKLQTNPNIPELFRNIFKNAYLPYRDPSTLKLFLKHINEFEYSHSEKLGDGFEYLLSVMGSQGDAGQFRTPRHIIDFIVACVNPQKNETIADPACGTAGFLLSAYKHILKQNTDKRSGDKLTPDQRKKLAENFIGYDISPDMVRLSLVNMYLHGFTTPHIFEYDTLSSEDRWNETFDVIIANPPFMTPKGGIRPHKKFGVQANKSEVLFTDYIAEHLNKNGRAGIVVPNGIVATSQTAYKKLRKLLVEDSLIAVISLPAGCFNPYSGVKTSVLMLDKELAKKTNHILFIKVENDGYDLGAQRREIYKTDLPLALEAFNAYKESIVLEKQLKPEKYASISLSIDKKKVLANRDILLNGDRYHESKVHQTDFDIVKLGKVVEINSNSIGPQIAFGNSPFIYIDIESVENGTERVSFDRIIKPDEAPSRARRSVKNGDVIVSTVRPNLKAFAYLDRLPSQCLASTGFAVLSCKEKILGKYLYQILMHDIVVKQMVSMSGKGQYPSITASDVAELEIPLPPLDIQDQIVKEIEGYQRIIDGAKMVVDNYKPTLSLKSEWDVMKLGDVCEINPKKSEVKDLKDSTLVSFAPMADLNENEIAFIPREKKPISEVISGYTYFKDDDVLVAKVTPCFENGKAGIARGLYNGIGFGSSEFFVLRSNGMVLPEWIYLNIKSDKFSVDGKKQMSGTSGLQRLPRDFVASFPIYLPASGVFLTITIVLPVYLKLKTNENSLDEALPGNL
jgi:type I restriction enzyme M protein